MNFQAILAAEKTLDRALTAALTLGITAETRAGLFNAQLLVQECRQCASMLASIHGNEPQDMKARVNAQDRLMEFLT